MAGAACAGALGGGAYARQAGGGAKPAQKPTQKPAAKSAGGTQTAEPVAGPQQTMHYPILILARGNEPGWNLRLGMKGPERLDRMGYPPIVLEPGEIVQAEPGKVWTYKAKDTATGAGVTVTLTREACSDTMADTKYTFAVVVNHEQIGALKGCGASAPDKFPEFRKKNQLDPAENAEGADKDKDKDKKTVLEPITNAKGPTSVAYLDANGKVWWSKGETRKAAGAAGVELSLSHDGKKVLYTRMNAGGGAQRSIVEFDADTGRSRELISGEVHQAYWSPDDTKVAFLKFDGKQWHVWTLPTAAPEKAAELSPLDVVTLQGWVTPNEVLATSMEQAYWIGEDGKAMQTVALREIYGPEFQVMSSDTMRLNPLNADLLLVTAYYNTAPAGAPTDAMGLNSGFFLYEVKSKRRVVLCPTDTFAKNGEWSRDGIQVYFTKTGPGATTGTYRIFWDGTGVKKYSAGNGLAIGK